jgi:serine/threonine protein phosphatase 1
MAMSLRRLFKSSSQISWVPSVPDGLRIYAVGDIHGRADLLNDLKKIIAADRAVNSMLEAYTVFLGDYIDRGPDSKAVLDVLSAHSFPTPIIPLCGNHEAMLLTILDGENPMRSWLRNGGVETLRSYGVDVGQVRTEVGLSQAAAHFRAIFPTTHHKFLRNLRLSHTVMDYFFCHAGIRPGISLEKQRDEDLLMIREEFLSSNRTHPKMIVHGHTPVQEPEIKFNRINLDTGAYISGRLTCLVLEGSSKRLFVVDATEAGSGPS